MHARARADARRAPLLAAALALAAGPACAQSQRAFAVVPTFTSSATFTDNRDLVADGKTSDLMLQVTPGVRVISNSGPLQGTLGYQLTGVVHSSEGEQNELRNTLDTSLLYRPVDDRFSIAARATYERQTISAYGVQSPDPATGPRNVTDVASGLITPRLRGTIAGVVDYDVQATRTITRAKDTDAGDSDVVNWSAHVGGGTGKLGWGLDASRDSVRYPTQPRSTEDRAFASLIYAPDVELRFTLRGGRERSDALDPDNGARSYTTYGASVSWIPSERTTASLDVDKRYFGNSHSLTLQHRQKRSSFRYTDVNDSTSTSGTQPGLTAYDVLTLLYITAEPDPIKRDARIRAELGAQGIDPNLVVTTGFLTRTRTVTRHQELAYVLSLLRDTFMVAATRTDTRAIFESQLTGLSVQPPVKQDALTASWSHSLTPTDSLSLMASLVKTEEQGPQFPGNEMRTVNLVWATHPWSRTGIALAGRRTIAEGPQSYTENAIILTLSLQF